LEDAPNGVAGAQTGLPDRVFQLPVTAARTRTCDGRVIREAV
jgi:hypothetical protein